MKKLILSAIVLASSVVSHARDVLTESSVVPSTDVHVLKMNSEANLTKRDDKIYHAKKTLSDFSPRCKKEEELRKEFHKTMGFNVNSYVNGVIDSAKNKEYHTLIAYYENIAGTPASEVDKRKIQNSMLAAYNIGPVSKDDLSIYKIHDVIAAVSTETPLTLMCQAVFELKNEMSVKISYALTRKIGSNNEDDVALTTFFNVSNENAAKVAAHAFRFKKSEEILGTPTRVSIYRKLVQYQKTGCVKQTECMPPRVADLAVQFLIGNVEAEIAFNNGLRF